METIAIVLVIALVFAAANLGEQLAASAFAQRAGPPAVHRASPAPEDPRHSQVGGPPRTRTDRRDLQLGIGTDFADSDVEEQVWPRG